MAEALVGRPEDPEILQAFSGLLHDLRGQLRGSQIEKAERSVQEEGKVKSRKRVPRSAAQRQHPGKSATCGTQVLQFSLCTGHVCTSSCKPQA